MLQYKVITPPTVEPVTLAEIKLHLRLSSDTLAGDTVTYQSIAPGPHAIIAAYGLLGTAINVLGKSALVNLNAGTCGTGGSVAAKIQESDDNVDWQDFAGGGFTTVTEANDLSVQEIQYTGGKQYIRVVATIAAAICNFSADVVTTTGDVTEDSLLSSLITAARAYCEDYTGRAFATRTMEAYLDTFPGGAIELPMSPLQSVTSIKYKDYAGTETTLAVTTDYIVDADSHVGRVVPAYGTAWPSFTPYPVNPIKIRYVAGFVAAPERVKQAIKLLVGHWYVNRESVLTGTISKEAEFATHALLSQFRFRWWG